MVLFNHRWVPAYAQAKSLIEAGEIGPVQIGYARKNDRIYVPTQMIPWAAETTPAWFLSSHDIDLISWFMDDEAVEVFATATYGVLTGRDIDCPDAVVSQVRYRRGAVVTYEASWVLPDTFPTMTDSFIQVIGEAGIVRLDRIHEQIELTTLQEFQYPRNQLINTLHGVLGGAVRGALFHVVDCLLTDSEPLVTLESSRHVTAVLSAIHRSLTLQQLVELGTKKPELHKDSQLFVETIIFKGQPCTALVGFEVPERDGGMTDAAKQTYLESLCCLHAIHIFHTHNHTPAHLALVLRVRFVFQFLWLSDLIFVHPH